MPRTITRQIRGKRVTMAPAKVAISPGAGGRRGMSTITYDAASRLIDRVAITGGKDPYKSFVETDALYYEKPSSAVVIFADGGFETFFGPDCDLVRVYGGTSRRTESWRKAKAKEARAFPDVLGCYYREGMDALAGVTEEIVGDALNENSRYRGSFDKYLTYQAGDLVIYPPTGGSWRTYVARREVTPPWFPTFFSGDVPGKSDAWEMMPTMLHGPDVLGAGGPYTDSDTVKRVQRTLIEQRARLDKPTQTAVDEMVRKGKAGSNGIDGIYGSATQAAVASFNRMMAGGRLAGDGPNITDNTLRALSLSTPIDYGQPVAGKPPTKAPAMVPTGAPVPGGAPPGLAVASPPWEIGGVPAWQIGLGALASAALGYGVYKAVRR